MPLTYKEKKFDDFERVIYAEDKKNKFYSIVAIHNTKRGPALGGCRYYNYLNNEDQEKDVLRLAEAMTYKNSLAEISFGGGKATINSQIDKKNAYELFAEVINKLSGTYITAGDIGIIDSDLKEIKKLSNHVCSSTGSDSGLSTAHGVFYSMQGYMEFINNSSSLEGKNIIIKGYGKVGSRLASLCQAKGANIEILDFINKQKTIISDGYKFCNNLENSQFEKIDIYSPCATGEDINENFISFAKNKVQAIIGGANNQLIDKNIEKKLFENNIVYCPDYCVNAGGVIILALRASIREELEPFDLEAKTVLMKIQSRIKSILKASKSENRLTSEIAREIAISGLK